MLWISLILFAIVFLLMRDTKVKNLDQFFVGDEVEMEALNALNLNSLVKKHAWQRLKDRLLPTLLILGHRWLLYTVLFTVISIIGAWYFTFKILGQNDYEIVIGLVILSLFLAFRFLVSKRRKEFTDTFPDALNILMSAVTAGDSLMQAISYVGKTMDNAIGREFKLMANRLKLGESPEVVLQRSCKHYPYPEFIFFTLTIRANISRGGQLKGVLARLIRVLVASRTLEKKKMAMTSEARISAKIVAAIPLIFTIILNYIQPQNVDFILHDPKGQYILFYVLGSEFLGLSIIWLLVRGVKA
ncbi:type II secretion system F family protein [Vibrio sp. FNV 38]|nr:type II secretion system F family protein [Vibrio sp. FNV 38]